MRSDISQCAQHKQINVNKLYVNDSWAWQHNLKLQLCIILNMLYNFET